jgi:hypothetical protein
MSDQGLRRRRTAENTASGALSGPRAHVAKGPNVGEWSVGINVLDEPNLRTGTMQDAALSTVNTVSFGGAMKTHTANGSLASFGDDTTHVRFGSIETSGAVSFGSGPRLVTGKANASLIDARYGSKENYARLQYGGIEFNGKMDKDKLSPHSALPNPSATLRPYAVAAEVGGTYKKKLPSLGPDYELSVAGKIRASVGRDIIGKDKSAVRIPVGPTADLKVKVSGGINVSRKKLKTE